MLTGVPLFPERASTMADRVDALFLFQLAITSAVAVLITVLVLYFAMRYRRSVSGPHTPRILGSTWLETFWSVTPLFIFLAMFAWGAEIYLDVAQPPQDALEIYVVGKQWMWKFQHQGGQREINELHVPLGRAVQLTMTSEDVIHSLFIPAFRIKMDVVPGRYRHTWFQATKPGRYRLFCSQYCGTNHSGMIGWVVVQEAAEFEEWLSSRAEGSLALEGRKLFLKMQCVGCHNARGQAPLLEAIYGTQVPLQDGRTVLADEAYLRESILNPRAKVVAGWRPIMPTFDGQLADPKDNLSQEDALIRLIAFIKALRPGQTPVRTEEFPPPAVEAGPDEGGRP